MPTGINAEVFLDYHAVGGDGNSFTIESSAEAVECTGMANVGGTRQRKPGLKDTTFRMSAYFNDMSPSGIEEVVSPLIGGSLLWAAYPDSASVACNMGYSACAVEISYSVEAPVDGMTTLALEVAGHGDLHRVKVLDRRHLNLAAGGSVASESIDMGESGTFWICFTTIRRDGAYVSGSYVAKVQESADDVTFADIAGASWTVTGGLASPVAVSASRYLRAKYTAPDEAGGGECLISVG